MKADTKKILKISILTAIAINLMMPLIIKHVIPFAIEFVKGFPIIYTTAASGDDSIPLFFSIMGILLNLANNTVNQLINFLIWIWSKIVHPINISQHKLAYRILRLILIVISVSLFSLYFTSYRLHASYEHNLKKFNLSANDKENLNRLWAKMKDRKDYRYICYLINRYSE